MRASSVVSLLLLILFSISAALFLGFLTWDLVQTQMSEAQKRVDTKATHVVVHTVGAWDPSEHSLKIYVYNRGEGAVEINYVLLLRDGAVACSPQDLELLEPRRIEPGQDTAVKIDFGADCNLEGPVELKIVMSDGSSISRIVDLS